MNLSQKNISVLLTGANGFVGTAVLKQLMQLPMTVTCVSRQKIGFMENATGQMHNVLIPELTPETNWSDCLKEVTTVIHCAARVHVMQETSENPLHLFRLMNVDTTLNLARQAAQAGVRQFIFISSIKVNGEVTVLDQPFTEDSIAKPEDAYGLSKHEAELALLELGQRSGMAITIVRPPLVYGPGVRANFLSMLRSVQRGLPLPLASVSNKRSFIYIENLVSLILCCIDHPQANNQLFLASDGNDLSTPELLRACAKALNVSSRLIPFPPHLLTLLARLAGKKSIADRLCLSLQVDISKARRQLHWTPPFTVEQGLLATVKNTTIS